MRNLKLTIEYDGTDFNGWQIQAKEYRTVQDEIRKALKTICKERVTVIGSGRTDSGVHALGQVANFKTNSKLPLPTFLKALNAHLPDDIVIHNIKEVDDQFHAQFNAKTKTYRYIILNRSTPCALGRQTSFFYPYPLDIRAMQREAKSFIGTKDFKSFAASDPAQRKRKRVLSTIRTIKEVKVRKKGAFVTIDVVANGFLYKMVRIIVGTLIEVGAGKLPKGSIKKILAKKDRGAASKTAKAKGLWLIKVQY